MPAQLQLEVKGRYAYVDRGDIRISVLRIESEAAAICSYGLDGDVANAELYLEALTEAIKIGKEFDAVRSSD